MSDEAGPERRYTDREVRLILKSAVEVQHRSGDGADSSRGLSLAELESVASEAGIDRSLIRTAAAELDARGAAPNDNAFLGGPTSILVERVVDASVTPESFDAFVEVVRASTQEVGETSTVGRQFGWRGKLGRAKTDVSISAGDTRVTIRVRVDLDELVATHFLLKVFFGGFMGGMGATGFGAAALGLGPFALVLGGGVAASAYMWGRTGYARAASDYRARASALVDALAVRAVAESGRRLLPK